MAAVVKTFGCLVQFIRSVDEKASNHFWSSKTMDVVGKIQKTSSYSRISGSAYHPLKGRGFVGVAWEAATATSNDSA